ncbi:hypothetical protein MNV49_003989 [Pseudohyphozyma bogoriensis]|nr:hypothetical protein MNV49_003989 [Pseudohyphozyma bogoriensis]
MSEKNEKGIFSHHHSQQQQQYPAPSGPPPSYGAPASTPPAGLRIPSTTTAPFPLQALAASGTGDAPFRDVGGEPVYVCSALLGGSVCPTKCAPHLPGYVRYPYGGQEKEHQGRFDILPITQAMEWVPASHGQIPKGRTPVEGGFEENGAHLFHAMVSIAGDLRVPGKTGLHLGAAHCAFGGGEHIERENYYILCWR